MMTYQVRSLVASVITCLMLLNHGEISRAAPSSSYASAVAPYVNDDTFVVAYFDLDKLPKADEKKEGNSIFSALPFLSDDAQAIMAVVYGLEQASRTVAAAGVDTIFVVAGLADVHEQGGPVFVFRVKDGASAKDAAATLKSVTEKLGPWGSKVDVRAHGERAVLVGSMATVDRYAAISAGDRSDLIEPLVKLAEDGAMAAGVFCPGPDFRRVVRELWPGLPEPFAALHGELADKWRHLELAIDAPLGGRPRIALVASDADSAALFAKLWTDLPKSVSTLREDQGMPPSAKAYVGALVGAMPAKQDGNRVELRFLADDAQMEKLRELAGDAADASMESINRDKRFRQFRDLSLAMINYESASKAKRLPASAIRDKEGRPLLSWRVAILPFLGPAEAALYRQFRLDEPWDSEHNRKLLDRMPDVFADPDSDTRKQIGPSKTTYLVPIAPGTVFQALEGSTFGDITDGTSKTIGIVEVAPSLAVEWTKPEDWKADIENPLEGVKRDDRRVFVAAFLDGHIEAIPVDVDFKKLRGLLTGNGGEVFDWP